MSQGRILLVSGPSGSGKTTFLQRWLERGLLHGLPIRGVISPRQSDGSIGIAVIGGLLRTLARPRTPNAPPQEGSLIRPMEHLTPRWRIDLEALSAVDRELQSQEASDFWVFDELGPLELELGIGLTSALGILDRGEFRWAAVSVRPGLLPVAQARWKRARTLRLC